MADGRVLHIGVDGRELTGHATGVGRVLDAILRVWHADAAFPHRVTVFLPASVPPALRAGLARFTWQVERAERAGTWWEQVRLPAALRRSGVDVLFAPAYTGPLRAPCPMVLVIHDVSFFAHREWFGWREGLRRRWLTRAAARKAHTIVTVSAFSAAEIMRYLDVPRDRIVVALHGAPDMPAVPFGRRSPIVLFVGSLFTRRHIPDLITAFAMTTRQVPGARLVLVGDNRTHPRIDPLALAREAGVVDRVEWRAYVPDAELRALYTSASVFAFLSEYEGFGLTPAEALASGAAPVLLDTPVTRELYEDCAILVPPDPARISAALTHLLTDPSAREALVLRGRKMLDGLSWANAAKVIRDALERAAS